MKLKFFSIAFPIATITFLAAIAGALWLVASSFNQVNHALEQRKVTLGELAEKHPAPADAPMRCAFGDADLTSLYLTTDGDHLYRAKNTGRKGVRR